MARPRKAAPVEGTVPKPEPTKAAPVEGTVRMVRDEAQHPGGPTTADVHPDEVQSWTLHGWREE